MAKKRYRAAIIGTGTAATAVATRLRAAGWTVAVVESRPFGGTCALRGCDPKKLLVGGAAAVDHARRMRGGGVDGDVRIDWPALMSRKRRFTDPIPEQRERQFADSGIDAHRGRARFTGPATLEVGSDTLDAERIVIAAGAEPVPLGIPGEEHVVPSDVFLSLEKLPRRIALIGGGYIAAEFSHIAARAGADVTVLQRGPRMLKRFDPDLVDWLMERFADIGVDVRTDVSVEAVERAGEAFRIRASGDGGGVELEADLVVHAAGRAPALADLDLESAGVAVEKGRLVLNEYLQSVSNGAVYAAGDAAQVGPPLTPVSGRDAEVVAANLLDGNRRRADYTAVPSVAFTIPPIAAVGLGEEEARRRGHRFRIECRNASDWYTARQAAEPVYGFKVLVDEATNRILGAHLVGPHADEVINVFALALRHELTAADLKDMLFAYPTGASDIGAML
ncbi:MAG: NAD(P)/FAD-dependent oxidoreductase [Gammaproteobacteria bacterium]|nr:NAD(P)/FAD-dependent oxidoreductase [Gammaproteobacteria bacterium]